MTDITESAPAVQSAAPPLGPATCGDLQSAARRLPGKEPERSERIRAICHHAGALEPIERDEVLKVLKQCTGINLKTLRSEMAAGRSDAEIDHLAFAKATIDRIGLENLLYTQSNFWRWSSGVWKRVDDIALAKDVIATLRANNQKVTDALVNSVIGLIRKETYRSDHEFNIGSPDVVNCLNCELELTAAVGWITYPHRREYYRTIQIPITYNHAAQAPLFIQFLHDVFRDDTDRDDKMRCVAELIGYTLMSHAKQEKFILAIGNGANGKSVLLRIIEALCGKSNVAAVKPSNFSSNFQRAHLHMKLANIVTELPEGKLIDDDAMKNIASGEMATVEHKGKDPFDFHAFATCWFGTNHMPATRDFSDGLYRRAVILTFNRKFAEHEQDKELLSKLTEELPGILNLALTHYAAAVARGRFTMPKSATDAREDWRREADQVRMFINECCTDADCGAEGDVASIFIRYEIWAAQSGIRQKLGKIMLVKRLVGMGYERHHSDGTKIMGLALKPTPDRAIPPER